MDLGDWLRSLGLESYEAAFRENEIDDTILPNLTADDLRDLGVSAVVVIDLEHSAFRAHIQKNGLDQTSASRR